jgi:hypothetical protein
VAAGTPARVGPIAEAVRIWQSPRRLTVATAAERDRLMRLWIEAEVLRLTNMRASQNRKAGNPGPEGSIAKLMFAEVNKRIYELCIDLLGAEALVGYDYTMRRSEALGLVGPPGSARKMFLRSRANSIEGGTSEIQRNILGERILGLPGDVRVDKELPWSKVPRGTGPPWSPWPDGLRPRPRWPSSRGVRTGTVPPSPARRAFGSLDRRAAT